MTWTRLGDRAVRFARPNASARALVREIRGWPGVVDVVIAAEEVAAYFGGEPSVDDARIAALASLPEVDEPVREHVIRVLYDGVDLEDIASATKLTTQEVIAIHSGATYTVETMGFAPGFAYLAGLDSRLELPRRTTPRTRVPAGSVAIAGKQSAVYPFDSPGGWHLVGTVIDTKMFDERGALLALGDRVRFVS
jgi:KipI family sensor histidine kinase inhibitor